MLLSNQKVMEKVSEVSNMIKNEKDFNMTKYIEENTQIDNLNIRQKRENDIRRYDFQRKISKIRKNDLKNFENGTEEVSNPHSITWCLEKVIKRVEFYDSVQYPIAIKEEKDLADRLAARNSENFKKNLSFAFGELDSAGSKSGVNLIDALKKISSKPIEQKKDITLVRTEDISILAELDAHN